MGIFDASPFGHLPAVGGLPVSDGTGDEIELWVRTTATAAGTAETLASLGLPAGSDVTSAEHPERGSFAWLSDEPMDLAAWWPRLLRAWPTSGWWPMVVPRENGMLDLVRSGGLDGPCEVPADHAALTRDFVDDLRPDGPVDEQDAWRVADWPLAAGTPHQRVMTTQYPVAEHLLLVPVARLADAVAAVGWPGAANFGMDGGVLSAGLRSWEERFGAVVGEMGPDSLMVDVSTPPTGADELRLLAREVAAWCPDPFADATLDDAAEVLADSPWMLWWD